MNLIPNLALSIIVTAAGCSAALAQPANTTKYKYYLVDGKSASEVRNAMVRNGPRQRGANGYALTTVVTTRARDLVQEETCQTDRYQLKLEFTITLPKMRNENALPAADHMRWQQFSSFVKKHEETHKHKETHKQADQQTIKHTDQHTQSHTHKHPQPS